jgi:hypothetical protein
MEVIDVKAAREYVMGNYPNDPLLKHIAVSLLEQLPKVEAVEVVHGRWEDIWGGKYDNQKFRCSVCNGKALYASQKDELGTWVAAQQLTPFCPHCGAKMDGDGNGT